MGEKRNKDCTIKSLKARSVNFLIEYLNYVIARTEIPSQFIDGHRSSSMAIAVHRWPSQSHGAHRWPSMVHRWESMRFFSRRSHRWESKFSITKIRSTWPCSKFQQNSHHLSFSFSLFKLCLGFRGCPNILFGNEVIHTYPYYLSL